jgi:hypothetical protein
MIRNVTTNPNSKSSLGLLVKEFSDGDDGHDESNENITS